MTAQIWNKSGWIRETDPDKLGVFGKHLAESGFKIIDEMEHYFTPYGYTKLYLLAESHFAIHTFPEEQRTYIEISSCNRAKYDAFIRVIERYFIGDQYGEDGQTTDTNRSKAV